MSVYTNDTVLYQAFLQGDPDAEKGVFTRYFKPLCVYAERMIGTSVGPEDIVIEAFQKTWERRANLATLSDFGRFMYRVVHNACLSRNLSERQHAGVHEQIKYLQGQGIEEGDPNEREILRAELLQEIYLEMEELPDRCRTIFKLIFLQGLSTDQIAAQLDLNVQTVRSQKARAIQLIRTRLLRKGRILAVCLLYSFLKEF